MKTAAPSMAVRLSGAGRLKALLVGLALIAGPAGATENDSFTARDEPLPDIIAILDDEMNRALKAAVDDANTAATPGVKDIQPSRACDENALYTSVNNRLGGRLEGRIETFANELASELVRKPARRDSIYRDFGLLEAPSLGTRDEGRLAAVMNLGGQLVGADKLGHFIAQGYSSFVRAYLDGKGMDSALDYGDLTERTYYGALVTGVYSYADLVANFNGIRFWSRLTGYYPDPLGGYAPPLISCGEGHWVLQHAFSWRDYVDAAWDEGINCNLLRNENLRDKLVGAITSLGHGPGHPPTCPLSTDNEAKLHAKYGRYFTRLVNTRGIGVLASPPRNLVAAH